MSGDTENDNGGVSPTFCLVLTEPEALEFAQWVRETVEKRLVMSLQCTELCDVGAVSDDSSRFYTAALGAMGKLVSEGAITEGECRSVTTTGNMVCLVIAIFWDGQSEAAKRESIQLRKLTEKSKGNNANGGTSNGPGDPAESNGVWPSSVRFIIQTLSAKRCAHMLKENSDALVKSLCKKLSLGCGVARHVDPQDARALEAGARPPAGAQGDVFSATDLREAAVAAAVEEGQGECFLLVSGRTAEEFQQRVEQLQTSAKNIGAGCAPVTLEPREVQSANNSGAAATTQKKLKFIAQEFLLRQNEEEKHIELRLAMCGNVDSGKSTLTSVLTRGCFDDGRGLARAFIFKHKHEATTGRTSSVTESQLGFSSTGEVVNYAVLAQKRGGGNAISNWVLAQAVVPQSAKVLSLYDLAGHERYLKTTVLGMTRNMPDYACVVISANNGIQRMTKEHIALCLALQIPFFVVVTRIDSTPENVRQETLESIHKLLKIPTVRKLPYPVCRADDIVLSAKNLRNGRITPIFKVSSVTGHGIAELLRFLNLLPILKDWRKARAMPREMVIDSTFFVTGVGTIVGGIVTQGVFRANDTVLLGPDTRGAYRPVHIKSIHVKGVERQEVGAGSDAAFCLKKEKRSAIRKGNILADPSHPITAYWQFEADVTVLYHSTTILVNYESVIHSITTRQSARITHVAKEVLRTGDRSLVRFHFLYRPEFMKVGQRIIFREGRTKGVGMVTKVVVEADESLHAKKRRQW